MAEYNVPVNRIEAGRLYLVVGGQSATYNSIVYVTGTTFRGVSGVTTFTYSGSGTQEVNEVTELIGQGVEYEFNDLDYIPFEDQTVLKGTAIEFVQMDADIVVQENTTIKGFAIEFEDGTHHNQLTGGVHVVSVVRKRLPGPVVPDPPVTGENRFTGTTNILWSNPANWSQGHVPTASETARIYGSDIMLDMTTTVEFLVIEEGYVLYADTGGRTLTVTDNVTSRGLIDFSGTNANLILKGTNNTIAYYIAGTLSTITYGRDGDQNILPLNYAKLTLLGTGTKYAVSNLDIAGQLTNSSTFNIGIYDFTASGNVSNTGGTILKPSPGNLLFKGTFMGNYATVNFSGNPNVEYRNTFEMGQTAFTPGNGTHTFRSMTGGSILFQTGIGTPAFTFNGPIIVGADTTLITGLSFTISPTGSINGESATSVYRNNSWLTLKTFTPPMLTGVMDVMTSTVNKVIYEQAGDYTIPYTNYQTLGFGNSTGLKKFSGHTTCLNFESGASNCDLESYNLTVTNNATISGLSWYKTGPGHISIGGLANFAYCRMYFSGNPTMDFKGGVLFMEMSTLTDFGSGLMRLGFTAGKMWQRNGSSTGKTFNLNNPIEIVGGVEFVFDALLGQVSALILNLYGTITGDGPNSKLTSKATINYYNATAPMQVGTLDASTNPNVWSYSRAGNQDVKAGTYRTFTLAGSGAKKLLGNVSVVNTYTLTAPATLDTNGFALTNP